MPEPITQTATTQPANTAVQAPTNGTAPQDILSRVSAFQAPPANPENPTANTNGTSEAIQFNVKDFEKIQDPVARKLAEDAYKSMQADYTRKTQSLASERKQMEALKSQLEQSGRYTPERIQQLLQDPSFINAAQEYQRTVTSQRTASGQAGDLSEEELSYLPDEQKKIYYQQKQTQSMLANLQTELSSMKTQKEDAELQARYKNYSPETVNKIYEDMMTGRVQATREHLFKVVDYEDAVKRAYALGRQDEKTGISEKHQASGVQTGTNTPTMSHDTPVRQKGESFEAFWRRSAQDAKAKLGK